jgi:predicted Zn-dependent peptidase
MWNQDPAIIARRVERIDALTPASVKETFKKYFPAERMTTVTLMPAQAGS